MPLTTRRLCLSQIPCRRLRCVVPVRSDSIPIGIRGYIMNISILISEYQTPKLTRKTVILRGDS